MNPNMNRFEEILDGLASSRLRVSGDVVLDEYLDGEVGRISPEAPVPVVRIERESVVRTGGEGDPLEKHTPAMPAGRGYLC